MVEANERKTPEEIKQRILEALNDKPLNAQEISKAISSNWSTVKTYVDDLINKEKVKEIYFGEKNIIYQKITGDTYFDIPISDEERKKFRTLFYLIIQEYKKRKKFPTKTHLAKCAVHVIKNEDSGLSKLPIVWYLYGMIPLMISDPSQDYQEETKFEHEIKIINLINDFIVKKGEKGSGQIQIEQHKEYGEELYTLSDEFFKITNLSEWDDKEILEVLNKFFIACPVDKEFPEIFDLTEVVLSIIRKLTIMNIPLQRYRKEILLTFDSLWKLIALYKFYKSKTIGKDAMNKETLLRFYVGHAFESRRRNLQETILELNSTYLNNLANFDISKIKLSKEVQEVRKIMEDWTGED